ncbi:RNA 2',3'-cyclic phosphodiesterase [Sphingomonas montanisoli]|uniref:RNA 2',3'-cyclic phosphodiesterase n=1 Tax=Sphingomonas montanisoli TaxID=2606412 RepID=A0A5D9CGH7_9SPHN|nr:RNA 2',3'-cyclic phosphodiesterase [Sphingomonas montanisoli]TZG29271.1 RNA 2',3'-cyclic phosphodiesterase [Sphingomonas montanisoli]
MFRLFVALKPSFPMRSALLDAMGGVPGARWQDDEQLHLTLSFIGDVDRHQAEDIAAALGNVRHPPVNFTLAGLGSFDRRDRIDSLWVGITPQDEVRSLHDAVLRALARAGVKPETRAYLPHITIARFSRGQAPTGPIPAAQLTPAPVEGRCEHFILYESHLGSEGSTYTAVERYPLV